MNWRTLQYRPDIACSTAREAIAKAEEFDESKHPRDDKGKFSDSGGATVFETRPSGMSEDEKLTDMFSRRGNLTMDPQSAFQKLARYWPACEAR